MTEVFDRRKQRTRKAIIQAFNELFFEGELDDIRVADIVARANVGRSTFYEHFGNAQQVFLAAFSYPLSILAAALAGEGSPDDMEMLLEHLWENRHRARRSFSGRGREQISRLLRELLEQRRRTTTVSALTPIQAVGRTEQAMGLIRAWLLGELATSGAELRQALLNIAKEPGRA
ncbi:MAG: TetR/AcrR family transcriptional regulator [Pseudomonadota bacterium]